MSDLTTPGEIDAAADNRSTGYAFDKSGIGPWIVDGVDIADAYTSIDDAALNAFAYNGTASAGLDAVFDPGEAYVAGWLVRDTQSTVTLPDNATTTVYLGYDPDVTLGAGEAPADSQNVIVGADADFGANDPRVPIYTVTTSAGAIEEPPTDHRNLKQPVEYDADTGITFVDGRLDVEGDIGDGEVLMRLVGWGQGFNFGRRGADGGTANLALNMENADNAFEIYSEPLGGSVAEFRTSGAFEARSGYAYLRDIELSGRRILWDRDMSGESLLFQKDTTTADTTMALDNGRVGINSVIDPSWPLQVAGTVASDGLYLNRDDAGNPGDGFVLPDYAGLSLPGSTEAGRMVYDSSRET